MNNIKLSLAIATFNEEKNIRSCLRSVGGLADEIVIVDGSSQDKTCSIAKDLGARVIETTNKSNFHINKQMAIDACRGEWILQLDADEQLSPGLKREIKKIINKDPNQDGFKFPRKNYFLGRWLSKGGQYPDYVTRLFKKGKGELPCASVHEKIKIPSGKIDIIQAPLNHYPYPSFAEYFHKFNRYTELTAQIFLKRKDFRPTIFNYFKLELLAIGDFLNRYIRHKGFIDGFPGFLFAWFSSIHSIVAFIKYWEKRHLKKELPL